MIGRDGQGASGIRECRVVYDQLVEMTAAAVVMQDVDGTALAPSQRHDDDSAVQVTQVTQNNYNDGSRVDVLESLVAGTGAKHGSLTSKYRSEVAAQLSHIAIHTQREDFLADCRSRASPTEKAIVYAVATSTRKMVLIGMLGIAAQLPCASTASVFVFLGRWQSLIPIAMLHVKRVFRRQAFTVNISEQSGKAAFGVYAPYIGTQMLAALSAMGCEAMPYEGIGVSCDAADCKWRTVADDRDDSEDVDFDAPIPKACPFSHVVQGESNLFEMAYPVSFHHMVLSQLHATSMSHMFLLTQSAHPGLHVAARECGLEVVALMAGPSECDQGTTGAQTQTHLPVQLHVRFALWPGSQSQVGSSGPPGRKQPGPSMHARLHGRELFNQIFSA